MVSACGSVSDMMDNVSSSNASTNALIPRAVLRSALDSKCLNVCHINVQSLTARKLSKFNELKMNLTDSKLDIICMTETWLDSSIDNRLISIDGFKILRHDRNRHGGGICVYVRKDLTCRIIRTSANYDSANHRRSTTEYVCLDVLSGVDQFMLAVYYNPPDVDCSETLFHHFDEFTVKYRSTFFIGDFNTDLLKDNSRQRRLKDIISSMAYVCINSEPTFFHQWGCSLLDLCLTESPDRVFRHDQISLPGVSHHDMLILSLKIDSNLQNRNVYYRDYKNFDAIALQDAFNSLNWNEYMSMNDPDVILEFLNDSLVNLHNDYIPLRLSKPKPNPWFTVDIERAIISRDISYRNWLRDKSQTNKFEYNRNRNKVNLLIRKSKENYDKRTLNLSTSSKQLWSNVKKLGVSKGKSTSNVCDASSEEINNYFSSNYSSDSHPTNIYQANSNGLVYREPDDYEIINAIFAIKSNAVGLDGISIKFIKIILPLALPFFKHLFNQIIATSKFPQEWKRVKVIPIQKKSNCSEITNLRPISLLCSLSKVFEKVLKIQICDFIERMSFLSPHQSGFRKSHSTTTTLLKVHDDIAQVVDKKGVAILLLIDFAKAFDRVSHRKLLNKLSLVYQFSSSAVNLIKSYLIGRSQTVYHNENFSVFQEIKSGVPQGSILGPLLFSLFINDLPAVLDFCSVHLFADDVQIYLCGGKNTNMADLARKVNHDLQKLLEWSNRNLLMINPAKTKALLINKLRSPPRAPELFLDGELVHFVDQATNLGVIVDTNLCWDAHINSQCRKIYCSLKLLNLTTRHLGSETKVKLFKALILPHFTYCDFVYSNASMASMHKLRVALNACVRYVHNLSRYSRVTHLQKSLLGCSFWRFFEYRTCLLFYKIINCRAPNYLVSKVIQMRQARTMNFCIPQHCSTYYGQSFFVRSVVSWNALPIHIKLCNSFLEFKRNLLERLYNMN